jgi:hypothetical protein
MSCGCGGGREAPYHPSDSYHFQGGGGIGWPTLDTGDGIPIVRRTEGDDESMGQPDRAPGGAGDAPAFPWGWAIVGALVWFLVRRAG